MVRARIETKSGNSMMISVRPLFFLSLLLIASTEVSALTVTAPQAFNHYSTPLLTEAQRQKLKALLKNTPTPVIAPPNYAIPAPIESPKTLSINLTPASSPLFFVPPLQAAPLPN